MSSVGIANAANGVIRMLDGFMDNSFPIPKTERASLYCTVALTLRRVPRRSSRSGRSRDFSWTGPRFDRLTECWKAPRQRYRFRFVCALGN
jgi:hypothetical protein